MAHPLGAGDDASANAAQQARAADTARQSAGSLVVASSARRQGVGDRLVKAIEEWAKGHGCKRVTVATGLHRAGAHQFYERLGFEHTGRRYAKVVK